MRLSECCLVMLAVTAVKGANLISILGNSYIYRNHHYPTAPDQPYVLRHNYAKKFGPYGDHYIFGRPSQVQQQQHLLQQPQLQEEIIFNEVKIVPFSLLCFEGEENYDTFL